MSQSSLRGKPPVVKFYIEKLNQLPQGAQFILDEINVSMHTCMCV